MGVSLQKGQKVSLKKGDAALTNVLVGLGWDEAPQEKKGLFGGKAKSIDCDAAVIMLKSGKLTHKDELVYFGNLRHKSDSVSHLGDNLTGAGEGDDEQIVMDLQAIPAEYDRLVVVVNIYQARERKQHFGMIQNAFIRIVDHGTGQEMFKFDLSGGIPDMTALIFGEIYRHNGEWKFSAMGQGTTDNDLGQVGNRYV